MQQIYLEDYDVNLEFPDQMSEDRIKDIIKRDYPEPDEKLVARFDNPETPSSSLTREDFVRYKQARPDMTWGQVPGVVAEAAVDTAARIVNNLPDAVRTYANIFDPGTSARTFLEGAARGTYDTETLIQMAKGYIGSKIDAFGGVSEDETTNQYNNFVKLKELQNVRGAIERGDKSAWNEYAEWAGMAGAKLDLAKINTQAAELTGEFIDPTFVVPGGKIASKASRAAARTLGAPVRAAGRAASIASEYTGGLIEGAKNRVKGATEIIDEATGGLANVVVPGGVGAAVAGGVVGGGTAGLVGAAVATPTLLDVAGGLLAGFGEAMSHTPTRLGGMARVHMHQPDTIAGKLAGRLQFLDRPVDYAGRAATGAAIGGAIGGGIGLASGGLEGLAQGIGSGGVLGAGGATLGRTVEGLTGASLRNAQDSDYGRWIETKTPEDRKRLAGITNREDRIARMDAEQILLQGAATVRHVDPDFVVDQKGTKLGNAAGFLGEEDGKPVVYLNANADARTMLHETFHAMARLDGFDAMVSTIKNTIGRMYSPEQVNDFIRDYENRLGKQIDISQRYQEKMGGSSQAKVDYILEEMGAEYFANFIKGKNSNYIFSGSSFAEGLKGVFDRFTKGKLDRVYEAFQSPIFDQQIRQSRRLDSAMRDLVKARREAGRKVDLSIDEPVKTYSAVDLADDDTFREMEAMGVAKTDRSGKRVIMGDSEQKKIAKERARTITNILDQVGGEGGLTRQPDGSYRGARFSAGQLQALLDSPLINDTIKKALAEYSKINEADQYVNVTYGAATMKTKLGKTRAKNIPISNRNAILYDLVISPITGTITARVLDMSLTESKARRLYNQTPEMQKIFGSEAQMFLDLHSYLNALRSGEKRTAEVLGSQRKSDYLNKVLSVRNVKGNPEVPEGTMTARQRRLFEGGKDFPWRSFRLDRIVAMQQKEGRPIVSFSESAYQRAQTHFTPIGGSRTVSEKPYSMAANGGFTTAPGTIRFVPAYHGSPHKFDEFSLSKIGTGEGATAYGYGLYFAEDKKVADHYRNTLTPDMVVNNELMPPGWEFEVGPLQADLHSNIKYYFERIKNGLDTDYAQRQVERKMSQLEDSVYEPVIRLMDFYNRNKGASKDSITQPKGNLYEVDFDADESTLIKWDENYDNQSDFVKSSIDRLADSVGVTRGNYRSFLEEADRLAAASLPGDPKHPDSVAFDTFYRSKEFKVAQLFNDIFGTYSFDGRPKRKDLTGQKIYTALEFVGDSIKDRQKNASELLKAHGIKGIKYKDGISRKASGEEVQTFNYVAFNDADIKIKTRNGEEINISKRDEPAQGAGVRFSPAADRPSIVQRKLNDPSESGTILNGVVSLTPSVMARFSPATNDPGYNIEQLAGKKAFIMMADRMKVGEYTARSGRVFELRGGPDHPDLADNQGTIAWAVEGGSIASQLRTAIQQTDGIGLVVLQKEESVAGNKTYSEVMLEEFKYDVDNTPGVKEALPKILKKASAMIQKKAKQDRLKKDKEAKAEAKAKGEKFVPSKASKWETFEFKTIGQIEEAIPDMTFGGRKTLWQQIASNDYKKKYGGIFWKDMFNELNDYKDDQGYRTGDIVKVIQFDKTAPDVIVDPKSMGLPVHPAYQKGVLGKSISNIKGRMSAYQLLREAFTDRVDEVTGEMKPTQQITKEGDIGSSVFRVMQLRGLTSPELQPTLTKTSLDPRKQEGELKLKSEYGKAKTEEQEQIRKAANRFSPQRSLNNRGGAVYTTAEGHRAIQTSSRAGVRVYGPTGRRIGPVFQSVEAAERHLSKN